MAPEQRGTSLPELRQPGPAGGERHCEGDEADAGRHPSLISRLESRGLVRRRADTVDRRRVLVEATERTRDLVRSAYGPIARAGAEL